MSFISDKRYFQYNMSLVTGKPVFGVCEQVRPKPACAATEASYSLESLDIETKGIILSKQRTTKVLIRLWVPYVLKKTKLFFKLSFAKDKLQRAWNLPTFGTHIRGHLVLGTIFLKRRAGTRRSSKKHSCISSCLYQFLASQYLMIRAFFPFAPLVYTTCIPSNRLDALFSNFWCF